MNVQHLWKKISLVLSGALLSASACLAAVPYDQVLVGGVGPGFDINYVKSIYGQPETTNFDTPTSATYTYDGLVLTSNPSDMNTIFTVLSSGDLKTPTGVSVGMDETVLEEKYGVCERKGEVDGVTYYHYASEPNPNLPDAFGGYSFGVVGGKIISIWAGVVAEDNGAAAAAAVANRAAQVNETAAAAAETEAVPAADSTTATVPTVVVAPVSQADAETIAAHNTAEPKAEAPAVDTKVTTADGTTVSIEKTE